MLQTVGETETDIENATDDGIYCKACGEMVTRSRWRLSMDGHEHVVFNPAGVVFRILCFREAPGIAERGLPSAEFSWFKGYQWSIALCRGCGAHMGWRYMGESEPPIFFGLIKGTLTSSPGGAPGGAPGGKPKSDGRGGS
ncbi:MAG: hypothetical protein HOH04_00400 [Rhodospirillaceae bacterium]|jgi:hypothetical protein|nr:hypothetical protein [Rhodospirillaceae bacterium]